MSRLRRDERTVQRQSERVVGSDVPKIDAEDKVAGDARFGSDLEPDDVLYAAVLYSTRTHAEIDDVDLSPAMAIDGVECALARPDFMGKFDDRVRHYGDVIAAIAATGPETADRAVNAIDYDLTPLDAVHDAREAVDGDAPTVHPNNLDIAQHAQHDFTIENENYTKNIDDYHELTVGDPDRGFEEADHVVTGEYTTPRVSHCNLDTHCTIAEWDDDTLVLTETLASHGRSQREIAGFLEIDPERVKIKEPPSASSSFGGRSLRKLTVEPVAASLAREVDRPVRLQLDREREFVSTATRHQTQFTLETGITADGEITAMSVDVVTDTGAYPNGVGHVVLKNSRDRPLDVYRIPNYEYEGVAAFTNNVPGGEYRAIGSTQLTFALESHLDEVAARAGLDRITFRRKNLVEEGYVRPHTEVPIGSCGVDDCLERGLRRFEELERDETGDPRITRGWGVAVGAHPTTSGATSEDSSEAILTLTADGTVTAHTGAVDQGQGIDTVIAQIVGHETGIPTSRVDVEPFSTTDRFADHLGSIASRSTYIIGAAVRDAAIALERELHDRAASALDVSADAIEIQDGVAASPNGEGIPVEQLLSPTDGDELEVYGSASSTETPVSYGAHFAAVEVDVETGDVDVLTFVASQDVGHAINPKMIEGQLEGAIQHGIEFALYSELQLDRGMPKNANLADYPVISPKEMPEDVACEIVESNEQSGPYGAKGVGTPSMPPVAPAIMNALADATGNRFRDPPIDSETVYTELSSEDRR
ncbi:xanthine dehydrogenase family protein molybdopterin-binding subunit [Natrarchaeobius chitinivorans]|uniref:Aldehyde oxidase/xanthine dehydrogenase a/b hammerhead domain-containing protein n=1 Tax=Natrarchaeobius chitinivorans TaxID=1679083 RepID=A0A3N6MGZ8_NATCH|nr:molybdopterin cofactor-binding domain-containing protein [Natrarchaeobius chitinivorans]RQG94861.1 hypothetical protein EA473_10205 [Natrarchaeobius chitinivorans]